MRVNQWTLGFLLALGILFASGPAQAECDYVRAYYSPVGITPCTLQVSDHNEILSIQDSGDFNTCQGEEFHVKFNARKTDGCGGSDVCGYVITIEGNSLTGTYTVSSVSGNCITLCQCSS